MERMRRQKETRAVRASGILNNEDFFAATSGRGKKTRIIKRKQFGQLKLGFFFDGGFRNQYSDKY
jgi:hypothetical protein